MAAGRLLVVDDEKNIREGLGKALEREGYVVKTAEDGRAAISWLEKSSFDVVITDLKMPHMDGNALLSEVLSRFPGVQAIVLTAHGDVSHAVEMIGSGVHSYLTKPPNIRELILNCAQAMAHAKLRRQNMELTEKTNEYQNVMRQIVGKSEKMSRVFDRIRMVAPTHANVLITGENGTGKELVARAIHALSEARDRPLISVHCAALNENLLESELFGHEKGAFTGASGTRKGRFELAHNSTLFLDEVGEIPAATQVKLLRVLQEKTFERVGGEKSVHSSFRLLCATNRDLRHMSQKGDFREDLYYRIAVIPIHLPPLRERASDIPFLIADFLREFSEKNNRPIPSVSTDAMKILQSYSWPGNIRELRNVMEGLVVMTRAITIKGSDLPEWMVQGPPRPSSPPADFPWEDATLADMEKRMIAIALVRTNGNKSEAARRLGIGRKTLQRKLEGQESP